MIKNSISFMEQSMKRLLCFIFVVLIELSTINNQYKLALQRTFADTSAINSCTTRGTKREYLEWIRLLNIADTRCVWYFQIYCSSSWYRTVILRALICFIDWWIEWRLHYLVWCTYLHDIKTIDRLSISCGMI